MARQPVGADALDATGAHHSLDFYGYVFRNAGHILVVIRDVDHQRAGDTTGDGFNQLDERLARLLRREVISHFDRGVFTDTLDVLHHEGGPAEIALIPVPGVFFPPLFRLIIGMVPEGPRAAAWIGCISDGEDAQPTIDIHRLGASVIGINAAPPI